MIYWLALGLFIISVLGVVALYYLWQLKKLRDRQLADAQQLAAVASKNRKNIQSSIKIIARAFLAGQVESAEACLRLSNLLDQLSVQGPDRDPFVAIDKMAADISHIPIKEKWVSLPKVERRRFELHIAQRQEELKDFIDAAMETVLITEF